jgi:imidazoleglycerol-phosphate dehydratase
MMPRTARIERATSESKVVVELDLDGSGRTSFTPASPTARRTP